MDLVILSANIFTCDPKQPWAEALGIKKNRIAKVGNNNHIKKECHSSTRVMELKDRLVTPGFVDGHLHFINYGLTLKRVDLRGLTSLVACRKVVQKAVRRARPGEWILGSGWNDHQWEEHREPRADDLDDIVPQNPVMLVRVCGHSVWVNSLALQKAGIDEQTPNLPGTEIVRDPLTGRPTGLLREYRKLLEKHIPAPPAAALQEAALLAQAEALAAGVTGVHSCEWLMHWQTLAGLRRDGDLKIRVHHLFPPEELEQVLALKTIPGTDNDLLWFGPMKLFADGSLGASTALLHEPYTDNSAEYGLAVQSGEVLEEHTRRAYQHGFNVAIHAIGDKALSNCLQAISGARRAFAGPRRDRIEHVQLFRSSDLALLRDLGLTASVQPVHLMTDMPTAEKKWGLTRCRHAYAYRSLLQNGTPLHFGSDAPVEPVNPLLGLQAAVTRQSLHAEPAGSWFGDERLSLEQSIRAFTTIPAWVSGRENVLGSITPGKWADLTVFDRDLFKTPAQEWYKTRACLTVIGGQVVYDAGG